MIFCLFVFALVDACLRNGQTDLISVISINEYKENDIFLMLKSFKLFKDNKRILKINKNR